LLKTEVCNCLGQWASFAVPYTGEKFLSWVEKLMVFFSFRP
jgi:hypothetical protein